MTPSRSASTPKSPTKRQLIERFLFMSFNFSSLTNEAKKTTYARMFDTIEEYAAKRHASQSAIDAMNNTLMQHHSEVDWSPNAN